jgi:hypothetical protein
MALQGVNVALQPLGAEAVWARTFEEDFGLGAGALADFFPGPAFLAWGRMGNIQGWVAACAHGWLDRVMSGCMIRLTADRCHNDPTASALRSTLHAKPIGGAARCRQSTPPSRRRWGGA